MDPTPAIVNSIILPYGASHEDEEEPVVDTTVDVQWSDSVLNPKNRTQSWNLTGSELWDIDGGETDRGFFCTVPKFARGRPPLRITTIVERDEAHHNHLLEESLQLKAFFRAGKWRIHDLPLTKHVRKALTHWSSQQRNFEREYESMPFGSTIVVESLHPDIKQTTVRLVPDVSIEQSWMSLEAFAKEASMSVQHLSSMTVPWESLELVSHPHENISIVRIAGQADGTSYVFKTLMEDTQYMYHEIRLLLSMESHPNIISKPPGLVMKNRAGREPGIAGFLLKLYPGPTLQERLQTEGHALTMDQKVAWANQLASALKHVRDQPPGYFPDFKPNNVVFESADAQDTYMSRPVLIDFEQRGTWYTWAPPEVRYLEYLELLALTSEDAGTRARYAAVMTAAFPRWSPTFKDRTLGDAWNGYNLAWASLSARAVARSQVYALGKVLWCVFEGLASPDGPRSVESFLEDFKQDLQFPEFRHTPPVVRQLIRRCTAGAPEWGGRHPGVVRDGNRLVPWGREGCKDVTAAETQEAADRWWREELAVAEEFVQYQYVGNGLGEMPESVVQLERDMQERPSLEEVLQTLSSLQSEPTKRKSDTIHVRRKDHTLTLAKSATYTSPISQARPEAGQRLCGDGGIRYGVIRLLFEEHIRHPRYKNTLVSTKRYQRSRLLFADWNKGSNFISRGRGKFTRVSKTLTGHHDTSWGGVQMILQANLT